MKNNNLVVAIVVVASAIAGLFWFWGVTIIRQLALEADTLSYLTRIIQ